jgi:hypothetical protein
MTIRQNGGVFGRHPEFSSVSVPDEGAIYAGSDQDLKIYHDGSNSYILDQGTGGLYIRGSNELALRSQGNKNIFLGITDGAAYIYHNGSVKLATASSGVSITGNVIVASGNGIDFSATAGTGTSELFDDYEEGTWTPELRFGNATTGITYDIQAGTYVKVGRQVTVSCEIDLSSKGTATGIVTLLGYPYTISGDGATAVIDTISGFASLVASGSTFLTVDGSTGRVMRQTATGREHLEDTNFTDASKFYFSMTYITV